jgi:hypothetical protein
VASTTAISHPHAYINTSRLLKQPYSLPSPTSTPSSQYPRHNHVAVLLIIDAATLLPIELRGAISTHLRLRCRLDLQHSAQSTTSSAPPPSTFLFVVTRTICHPVDETRGSLSLAVMPYRLDTHVLTVDANVIHKVDTANPANLYSMWTGEYTAMV